MKIVIIVFLFPLAAICQLTVINPGMEGDPSVGQFVTPTPWTNCMYEPSYFGFATPDTQPGWYGISLDPSEGISYIGLGHIPDYTLADPNGNTGILAWQEGFSQELSSPMVANGCPYVFSIDLANGPTAEPWSQFATQPINTTIGELRVYGGYDLCSEQELLWSSGPITNDFWETYTVEFTPSEDYSHILFQCVKTEKNAICAYILADNITPITNSFSGGGVGENQEICSSSAVLNANELADGQTGSWSTTNENISIVNTNDPNSPVSNLSPGENIFIWTVSSDCSPEATNNLVSIFVLEPTIVDAGEDIVTCEHVANMNASLPSENEFGSWSVVSGSGTFQDINSPYSVVSNLGDGQNVFEWTIESPPCGETGEQIEVYVINGTPTVSVVEEASCLEPINLIAEIESGEGEWSSVPSGGVTINDPLSPNTFAVVESYGLFEFFFEGCDGSDSAEVTMSPSVLDISGPNSVYCLEDFQINVSSTYLAPGSWSVNGPGPVNFDNAESTSPIVSVEDYGVYDFYYSSCGSSDTLSVELVQSAPIIDGPGTIFCSMNTDVSVTSNSNGTWSAEDNQVVIIDNNNNTAGVYVGNYGEYTINYTNCDGTDSYVINFQSDAPHIIASDHENCNYSINLSVVSEATTIGPWQQLSGPSTATIINPYSSSTEAIVSEYGLYTFSVTACDSITTVSIGVSCPPVIPNSLSPNGDQVNDLFYIDGLTPNTYSQSVFFVFNRWGEAVYQNHRYGLDNTWWDGVAQYNRVPFFNSQKNSNMVTDGVYFYTLELFNLTNNQKEFYSGSITVVINKT
mgnify:CR=1 FL=1